MRDYQKSGHRWAAWHGAIAVTLFVVAPVPSEAALKFYYDPASGNVAFDTSETRTGWANVYGLFIVPGATDVRFRPENHIRLTNSTLFSASERTIEEATFGVPMEGLFTIGDVLPPSLPEDVWLHMFAGYHTGDQGRHTYMDAIGQGFPPPAEFIFGPPEGEFDNQADLLDPDELPWASSANLVYHAATGEVFIDTSGAESGYISSYLLSSDEAFRTENYTPLAFSNFAEIRSDSLAMFADAIEPGRYSLGEILQPGLAPETFQTTVTSARFLGRAGFQSQDFDFDADAAPMQLVFVPEPGALLLVLAAAPLALKRRNEGVKKRGPPSPFC